MPLKPIWRSQVTKLSSFDLVASVITRNLCRHGEQTDVMGRLILGSMCTEGSEGGGDGE
jgi:hypothetical protein